MKKYKERDKRIRDNTVYKKSVTKCTVYDIFKGSYNVNMFK